ncbi:UPF0147 family protein [Candidatus Woesearchaeota archaeon]|nr:UPF0147 family protein [Candidatus Woesearchaeota archaeon]
MASAEVEKIIAALGELEQDTTVPRNIKEKTQRIISALKGNGEVSVSKDKALQELDEIADDINLQPYTRTQIWSIVSMLEKL